MRQPKLLWVIHTALSRVGWRSSRVDQNRNSDYSPGYHGARLPIDSHTDLLRIPAHDPVTRKTVDDQYSNFVSCNAHEINAVSVATSVWQVVPQVSPIHGYGLAIV